MTSVQGPMRPTAQRPRSVGDVAHALGLGARPADAAVTLTGVAASSADVVPGDLFVALRGTASHGARYTGRAVRAGAAGVLTDHDGQGIVEAAISAGTCPAVPVLTMPAGTDPRSVLGAVATWFYDHPGDALTTFAVTGTNGKTTTTYLIDHLLSAIGRTVGLIGTVETRSGARVLPSRLTTPDAAALQGVLAVMREDRVDALAMEVSSHALVQHRVDGIVFDVAGFTNLSQDHLDFHGTLEDYFLAKAELFTPSRARRGVVIVDETWGRRLASTVTIPVVTLHTADGPDDPDQPAADWAVVDVEAGPTGSAFTLVHRDGRTVSTSTSLPGAFNVANAALALVMVIESGVDVAVLTAALEGIGGVDAAVPGRMEPVASEPRVIVDFAHNPDALGLAIAALRPTTVGRLIVVFGATGERDTGKRPIMGAVAVGLADVVVVTDDDPHGEDASQIRQQVLVGARAAAGPDGEVGSAGARAGARQVEVLEIAPRARAIAEAIRHARDEDTVLVAGRGHEVWQEINGVDHPLDDRVEARAAAATRRNDMTKELSK